MPAAALGLILLTPVRAVAALAVRLSSPRSVLFRQRRVGRHGQTFDLIKFRSTRVDTKRFNLTPADDGIITGVWRACLVYGGGEAFSGRLQRWKLRGSAVATPGRTSTIAGLRFVPSPTVSEIGLDYPGQRGPIRP